MSNYDATTNAYMNLANSQANSAYKSTYLQSGGAYNPISTNSTSFTGGNQSIFTNNTTNPIDYSDIQQVSASGDENGCTDGADDGKIGFGETVGNFFKGLVSPITSMFESPGNFIKGAAMIAGGAILCAATGGAAAPLLVAAGVGMGGFQAVKGAINAAGAKTDAEAKQAWQDIGCGTGMVAGSIVGAKAAAKGAAAAGVEGFEGAESMNALQATKACITNVGKAGSASIKAFTSGAWKTNLGLTKNVAEEPKAESKAVTEEPKTEPKNTTPEEQSEIGKKAVESGEKTYAEQKAENTRNRTHNEKKIANQGAREARDQQLIQEKQQQIKTSENLRGTEKSANTARDARHGMQNETDINKLNETANNAQNAAQQAQEQLKQVKENAEANPTHKNQKRARIAENNAEQARLQAEKTQAKTDARIQELQQQQATKQANIEQQKASPNYEKGIEKQQANAQKTQTRAQNRSTNKVPNDNKTQSFIKQYENVSDAQLKGITKNGSKFQKAAAQYVLDKRAAAQSAPVLTEVPPVQPQPNNGTLNAA